MAIYKFIYIALYDSATNPRQAFSLPMESYKAVCVLVDADFLCTSNNFESVVASTCLAAVPSCIPNWPVFFGVKPYISRSCHR